MTNFDWETWESQTLCMPKGKISDGLLLMLRRKREVDAEPEIIQQRNETAARFHASQTPDLVGGVRMWVAPIDDFAGYPAGMQTHHDDAVWVNPGPDIAMGEPGVSDEWVLDIQEEPDSPEEEPLLEVTDGE